jgi:hypothetical protein
VSVELNTRRGLALNRVWLKTLPSTNSPHLLGTLPHGYFDDIVHSFDWYSGALVIDLPAQPKVTDLNQVTPQVETDPESGDLNISARFSTRIGCFKKVISIPRDAALLRIAYEFDLDEAVLGCIRFNAVTINPEAFDTQALRYQTNNGGDIEEFSLPGHRVDHGGTISWLVSSRCAVGMTGGTLEIGDRTRTLRVSIDKSKAALVGQVTHQLVGNRPFCRLILSALEYDETRRPDPSPEHFPSIEYTIEAA